MFNKVGCNFQGNGQCASKTSKVMEEIQAKIGEEINDLLQQGRLQNDLEHNKNNQSSEEVNKCSNKINYDNLKILMRNDWQTARRSDQAYVYMRQLENLES